MNRTIVFEILVVIEVPEPFLLDPYLWKTDELLMLCAGHIVTPNLLDFQPQVLWSREAQAFQPHPIPVGLPPPNLHPAGREYHCFPIPSSLWACPRPLALRYSGSDMVKS